VASEEKSSGISIQTLVISALAAVAAAVIVPLVWERGTLIATAMTPVIVALVSEALRKPAEKITAVKPRATRRTGTGAAVRDPDFDPLPPGGREAAVRRDDPFGLRERPKLRRRHWWIALATGAAAFAVAVAVLTMSELVFGGPATRDGGNTTFFPGGTREREDATPAPTAAATPEATETAPEATETPEPTATPTATPTESPAPLDAAPTPTATP
jgi:hypothetical protein